MSEPYRYRVYWEDTDAGGVVYHARYLHFLERARSDWLLRLGFPQISLRERDNRLFVVTSLQMEFLAPARLEDELAVGVAVEQLRAVSMRMAQTVTGPGNRLLLTAKISIACLAADSFRPARMPRRLHAAVADYQRNQNE